MKRGASTWLLFVSLSACEVVADFNRDKLDEQQTIGPTPLPSADGAVALMPDSGRPDGALIGPEPDDAGMDASSRDASHAPDASRVADAAGIDSSLVEEVDPAQPDATVDVLNEN